MSTHRPSHRAARLRPREADAAGFSLMEVLIASGILIFSLLWIADLLPTADMTLHRGGQISKGVSLAQEMIEMIKNDPFSQVTLYNNVDTRITGTYPADVYPALSPSPVPGDAGNFMGGSNVTKWKNDINLYLLTGAGITNGYGTINVDTVATDGTGNPILRRVRVTVNWTESGRQYQVSLATLASGI